MSYYSEKYSLNAEKYRLYYRMFFKKGTKILDVGCGVGNFLLQDPANIIGTEIDSDQISKSKKASLKIIRHDINSRFPFKDNEFEAVNCQHVLEHLENPLFVLREMGRVLKKGGKLVIVTDPPSKYFWDDYTHKRPFTPASLSQITYSAGFKNYSAYYFPNGLFGINLASRMGLSAANCKSIEKFFGKIKRDITVLEAYKYSK